MRGTVRMVDKNIYIVQGEINTVVGAIKRNARWNTHTHLDEERDPLLHSFSLLKEVLNNITEKKFHVLSNPEASCELLRDYAKMAYVHSAMVVSKECLLVYYIGV
ncbi:hypothetical protein KIL84_003955 [Mauremys mutica]|uniref:Uncharacterized protein n=1 Tax=Mauremys mutica TaxID=74926 RepID=A0A9D3WUV5_9SAUR|nr:hypothetical protein KIL84_003955 [Mauremys mutica]